MKKFRFTLEKLHNIKTSQKKELQNTLENIDVHIRSVENKLFLLEQGVLAEEQKRQADLKKGVSATKLHAYEYFFQSAAEEKKRLLKELEQLFAQKEQVRAQLMRTHNEIKALDKMHEIQLAQYKADVQAAQNKELDGFVSFQAHASGNS